MAVDASIALGYNPTPQGPDVGKVLQQVNQIAQMRQQQAQQQSQNALKQIFADPNSLDPSGNPTQNALQRVMAIDPDTGMKLRETILQQQQAQTRMQDSALKRMGTIQDLIDPVRTASITAYHDALDAGKSPQAAQDAADRVLSEGLDPIKNGGQLHPDEAARLPTKYNDATFTANSAQWQQHKEKLKADERADKAIVRQDAAQAERERHDRTTEERMAQAAAGKPDPTDTKWQVLTDPKTNQQYRYNPQTAQATTLRGEPYEPGGAAKIGTAGKTFTPEMGDLMGALAERGVSLPSGFRGKDQQIELFSGLLERNKGKTPDQIADGIKKGQIEFGAQKKETQTAAGQAGKVEVARNELEEFIPQAREASLAVPRGKFVPLSKLMQMADTNISDPALKNFKIKNTSLMNAYDQLAARGGTDAEKRKENRSLLLTADSPQAYEAGLKAFQQEADAAKRAAFKATKAPELAGEGDTVKPASTPPLDKLTKGQVTTFSNGQKWTIGDDGKPSQVK